MHVLEENRKLRTGKIGAGQTQRWVLSVREDARNKHAQGSDGCVGDERHGSRRVLSQG